MATGVTGQTQIDGALRTFIAEADYIREHKGVMKQLVDKKDLPKKMGRTWNEPVFRTVAAASLTDGVEFDSPSQVLDDLLTITPAEVGVQVLWTNRMNMTMTEDFARLAADLCTNALEYKLDVDLLTQIDSFSTALGGTTTSLTPGLISAVASALRGGRTGTTRSGARTTGEPAPTPINAVFHPHNHHDLAMNLGGLSGSGANTTAWTTSAITGNYAALQANDEMVKWMREYYVGDISGVAVHLDGNFTVASNAIKGGVFSKKAIVLVNFQGMQDYRVRTVDGRAVRHTMWIDYGYGERADNWGHEVAVDVTAPTT